jgi:hypothetical protein
VRSTTFYHIYLRNFRPHVFLSPKFFKHFQMVPPPVFLGLQFCILPW